MKIKGQKVASWYTIAALPIAVVLIVFALFYNYWYMEVVNYIAMDLNRGASLEDYDRFITGFLMGGTIQPLSTFQCNLMIILAFLLMYSGAYVHIHGKSTDSLKNLVKMHYWSNFFLFKYQEYKMSEGAKRAIAEMKRNEKRLKAQQLESIAKKEIDPEELEKRRLIESLKSKRDSNEKPA